MQPNQTDLELCAFSFGKVFGAVEKTRTSTGYYPTATSTLRVYQFRHDRLCSIESLNRTRCEPLPDVRTGIKQCDV
jgi:hypothetical protein